MRVFDCESGANADCTFAVNGTMQDFGDNVVSNVEPQAAATFATPCRVEGLKHALQGVCQHPDAIVSVIDTDLPIPQTGSNGDDARTFALVKTVNQAVLHEVCEHLNDCTCLTKLTLPWCAVDPDLDCSSLEKIPQAFLNILQHFSQVVFAFRLRRLVNRGAFKAKLVSIVV